MGESSGQYTKLPPGWDCKYDQATGNCYYINYFTKAMQLEDPRMRYKQLQNERCSTESIPLQPLHGSPYHVYPSNNYPAVRAFQGPANIQSLQNMSSSPLLSSRSHLEMSPLPLAKSSTPQTPRPTSMSRRSTIQETSFSNQIDTDAVVTKIQNMFPTAGENHIRLLLKRYMKTIFPKADETLLLDILANADNNVQIASEKLISMGYVKREYVPPKVSNRPELDADGRPKKFDDVKIIPLRPKEYSEEEKKAMILRLKEKYNKIAERIILMALESVNYSEDRAMQILQIVLEEDETRERKVNELQKVDEHSAETTTDGVATNSGVADSILTVVLETTNTGQSSMNVAASSKAGQQQQQRLLPSINVTTPSTTTTTQIILSPTQYELKDNFNSNLNNKQDEKNKCTEQRAAANALENPATSKPLSNSSSSSASTLQSYQTITTRNILERCNTSETGTNGFLQKHDCTSAYTINTNNTNTSDSILEKLKLSRSRDKTHSLKNSTRDSTEEHSDLLQQREFKSILGRIAAMGHNAELAKGPDDSILLADYVTWNGANPDISVNHKQAAIGPDAALLSERNYMPVGRNPELCKGPKMGLAKGSIYAQLASSGAKSANIKCN